MCDEFIHQGLTHDPTVSRRTFGLMTVLGGVAAAAAAQAAAAVVEKDVEVKTPDGTADAALFHPPGQGTWPAVLIWPDILGLRPVFREMGRRLAAQGYVVLVPNPFYRARKAPVVDDTFDFNKPEDRAKVMPLAGALTHEAATRDATAFVAFLDAQPQTARTKKIGTQGYCMGGPLVFRTAAAVPNRVGAVASFHGGGLVSDQPTSPHQLVARSNAAYLVAIAQNDDQSQPTAKDVLRKTFADTGRKATVEVYPAAHGWCVRGSAAYNEAAAEKAWSELLALYKQALV
jgi:carboxymethylenebutenolidase